MARATDMGAAAQLSAQFPCQLKNCSSRDIWSSTARDCAPPENQKPCQRSNSGFHGSRSSREGASMEGWTRDGRPQALPAASTMGSR